MNMAHQKVSASHLKRQAYCYVRQSTLKQVFENTESTKRQYALRERAIALGWQVVQIVTVDSDLGETATSVADRQGFQKLMTEVSLGRVGLVMGLEVSRLARNNADWARLLEICAITAEEVANLLGMSIQTVRRWGKETMIKTYPYNDRNGCLYEHPGVNSPLMKKMA